MKKKLAIIGAGGHGKVVADTAKLIGRWSEICFLDDNATLERVSGIAVAGQIFEFTLLMQDHDIFVSIGNNKKREELTGLLEKHLATIPSIIHPSAVVAQDAVIGTGTIVAAGAVINTHTIVGQSCIINTRASIGHDNSIGNYAHISSGCTLAGTVTVGEKTWIGCGSVVSNNISIAENCVVGAGSLVVADLKTSGTYIGSPVKKIPRVKYSSAKRSQIAI